jgi:hypothetical protein
MRYSMYRWIIFPILLLWGSVAYADCAAGNILIGISKGGFKKFFDVTFLTYCVTFPNAEVSLISTEEIPRRDGHSDLASLAFYREARKQKNKDNNREDMLQKNPWLVGLIKYSHSYFYPFFSSTGSYVAFLRDIDSDDGKKSLLVYELSTRKEIATITTRNRIEAVAWSSDSKYIAVLTETSRACMLPFELLLAFVGHPIPVTTFYLNVYDLSGRAILTDKLIVKNVKGGSGSLFWAKDTFSSYEDMTKKK